MTDDVLRSGRITTSGGGVRASARRLYTTLDRELGNAPFVQAVVAVWGTFDQGRVEGSRIVYLEAARLPEWLLSQPTRLSDARQTQVVGVLESIARESVEHSWS